MSLPVETWKYFVRMGVWPKSNLFDPKGWMSNFSEMEKPFALALLEGFIFFSNEMGKELFKSAFMQLSKMVITDRASFASAQKEWKEFLASLYVVRVTGEKPSDADSGYIFTRYARDILGMAEDHIIDHSEMLYRLEHSSGKRFLFVDDFVGSGVQFVTMWDRLSRDWDRNRVERNLVETLPSLDKQARKHSFYYCALVCTEKGKKYISDHCLIDVIISAAHYFGSQYSALSVDSLLWPKEMQVSGPLFVEEVSHRARIECGVNDPDCWKGFGSLGLALGFEHGCPDATLPIFSFDQHGWKPLVRKG